MALKIKHPRSEWGKKLCDKLTYTVWEIWNTSKLSEKICRLIINKITKWIEYNNEIIHGQIEEDIGLENKDKRAREEKRKEETLLWWLFWAKQSEVTPGAGADLQTAGNPHTCINTWTHTDTKTRTPTCTHINLFTHHCPQHQLL